MFSNSARIGSTEDAEVESVTGSGSDSGSGLDSGSDSGSASELGFLSDFEGEFNLKSSKSRERPSAEKQSSHFQVNKVWLGLDLNANTPKHKNKNGKRLFHKIQK